MKLVPASKRIGLGAFAASVVAYSVGLGSGISPDEVLIEGAGDPAPAAIGSAFADLVEGVQEPVETDITDAEIVEPDTAETPDADAVEPVEPDLADVVDPEPVAADPVDVTDLGITVPVDVETAVEDAETLAFTTSAEKQATTPVIEAVPTPVVPLETPEPVTPAETSAIAPLEPVTPDPVEPLSEPVTPDVAPEVLEPVEDVAEPDISELAPALSMRPNLPRPEVKKQAQETARRERAKPAPKPAPKSKPAQAPGNANVNAKQGAASGTETGTAARSGAGGNKNQNGNAAMENYAGKVQARIFSRSRRINSRARAGSRAVVAFTIAPNGSLASISLERSSGNERFDRDALNAVRRAAPFPKVPNGRPYRTGIPVVAN